MQVEKSRCPSIHLKGLRQQDHGSMNVYILSSLHVKQKQMIKKAFDLIKKKTELEWDELQAQM
jgi:hypothetical protein